MSGASGTPTRFKHTGRGKRTKVAAAATVAGAGSSRDSSSAIEKVEKVDIIYEYTY